MNVKTTIALVVLLLVAIGGYLLVTRTAPPTGGGTAGPERLVELDPDAIDTVRVERGPRRYTLERRADGWQQTQPTRFPVQPFLVEDLLTAATGLEVVESLTPGGDDQPTLAELGLDPPIATMTLNDTTLRLGRTTVGGRGYAMLDGAETAVVVDDALHAFVADRSINDLRQKSLDAPSAGGVERIEIEWRRNDPTASGGDDRTTVALRKVDGDWYLGQGTADRADRSAVTDLVRELAATRVDGFIEDDGDLASFGLEAPRETYALVEPAPPVSDDAATPAGPRRSTLRVGNTADFAGELRYATWTTGDTPSRLVFSLRDESLDDLRRTPDDFRDPALFTLEPASVASVAVTGPAAKAMTIHKDRSAYAFAETGGVAPPSYGVDSQDASDWLDALLGLTSASFAALPADTDEPGVVIELTTTGDDRVVAVRLYDRDAAAGDPEPRGWLAVVGEESAARALTDEQVDRVLLEPLALRNRDVIDVRPADVSAVELDGPGWAELRLTRTDDGWAAAGEEASIDQAAAGRLVGALSTLRAEAWVEPDDTQWRAMTATATLEVGGADAAARRVLRFDPQTGLARIEGEETTAYEAMQLPEATLARLTRELREPEVLAFAVDEVGRVELTRGGEGLTVVRPAIGRPTAGGSLAASFDESARTRLVETLAGLEAGRFVATPEAESLGPPVAEWQVELGDGTTRRLAAYRLDGGRGPLVWCTAGPAGSRWFTLPQSDANALGLPIDDSAEAAREMK
jgi:hypothetical protein